MSLVRRAVFALAVAVVAACSGGTPAPSSAAAALPDPVEQVRVMYEAMQSQMPRNLAFTDEMNSALERVETLPKFQDIAFMNADIYTGAQDTIVISNVRAEADGEPVDGRQAVLVHFHNSYQEQTMRLTLTPEEGEWRIYNIQQPEYGVDYRKGLVAEGMLSE